MRELTQLVLEIGGPRDDHPRSIMRSLMGHPLSLMRQAVQRGARVRERIKGRSPRGGEYLMRDAIGGHHWWEEALMPSILSDGAANTLRRASSSCTRER